MYQFRDELTVSGCRRV